MRLPPFRLAAWTLAVVLGTAPAVTGVLGCNLSDLTVIAPSPEMETDIAGEIASHPGRYANGRGRLWTVSDQAGRVQAHLFGTFHLPHPVTTWLPPAVYQSFHNARLLIVESNGQRGPTEGFPTLRPHLSLIAQPEPLTITMERVAPGLLGPELRRHAITDDLANRLGPIALAARLSGARCSVSDPQRRPPPVIDFLLQDWAHSEGKRVTALESTAEALEALGANMPPPEQVQRLAVILRRALAGDQHVPVMLASYKAGRIDRAMALDRSYKVDAASRSAIDRFHDGLFGERNAAFALRIDALVRRETDIFVAIGAGHLIGEDGVVERLHTLGWRVEAVAID